MKKMFEIMSNLQTYYHFQLDFQNVDQHTGGKWSSLNAQIDTDKNLSGQQIHQGLSNCIHTPWEANTIGDSLSRPFDPFQGHAAQQTSLGLSRLSNPWYMPCSFSSEMSFEAWIRRRQMDHKWQVPVADASSFYWHQNKKWWFPGIATTAR